MARIVTPPVLVMPLADPMPLMLSAYRMVTAAAGAAVAPRVLARRLKRGKENPERIAERRGETGVPRPPGPLIWVHGASVGEFIAVLPLVERICAQGFTVLMTTGTVTSAELAQKRLPVGALHQFIPLDMPSFVARFLDHWQPDLALFVESDLWPNIILNASARKIPMVLVNGRISVRSYHRWRRFPRTIATLLRRFDLCLVRSRDDEERFGALGAPRIGITGNLKFDVPALPVDAGKLDALTGAIAGRIVVTAASTHPGEEGVIVDAHRRLRAAHPDLLTIIAPRHPHRGAEVGEIVAAGKLRATLRSRGALPGGDTNVYIFDTLGELGLVYGIAPIVFMGGSLVPHGGQNPIEAIKFGAAILHGPHVSNFADIYEDLGRDGGAVTVSDAGGFTSQIGAWLYDGVARDAVAARGQHYVDKHSGALDRTLSALEPYFTRFRPPSLRPYPPPLGGEGRAGGNRNDAAHA
jgi:3-deoxy-D-manno-octulosonic-acid transferase